MKLQRSKPFDPSTLVVRDNIPEGCVISLAGINPALSFAAMFRDELVAAGFGLPRPARKVVRSGRKKLD